MNTDERVEAALRRQPSDERTYVEPLSSFVASEVAGLQRVRPVVRPRVRPGAVAAIAMIIIVLAVGVGVATVGLSGRPAAGPSGPCAKPQLTWLIGCSGKSPGFSLDFIFSRDFMRSPAGEAETATSGPASALRALLASDASRTLPSSNWTLVYESTSQVQFLALSGITFNWVYVDVQSGSPTGSAIGTDGWHAVSWGNCELYAVPPAGYGIATWTVDPATPYVAGATELHVLVTEQACHGQAAADGRIDSYVAYSDTATTVTVFVRTLGGTQTCPGTAPTPYVLHLDRPLGGLALMDGGPWPAMTRALSGQATSTSTPGMEVTTTPSPVPSPGCSIVPAVGVADGCGTLPIAAPSVAGSVGPTPAATFLTYLVRPGDNMSNIAPRFALRLWELQQANPEVPPDGHIEVGQILRIPSPGQLSPPSAAPSVP